MLFKTAGLHESERCDKWNLLIQNTHTQSFIPLQVWISMPLSTSRFKPSFMWNKSAVCVACTPFVVALDINLCVHLPLYCLSAVIQHYHSVSKFWSHALFKLKHTVNPCLFPTWCQGSSQLPRLNNLFLCLTSCSFHRGRSVTARRSVFVCGQRCLQCAVFGGIILTIKSPESTG